MCTRAPAINTHTAEHCHIYKESSLCPIPSLHLLTPFSSLAFCWAASRHSTECRKRRDQEPKKKRKKENMLICSSQSPVLIPRTSISILCLMIISPDRNHPHEKQLKQSTKRKGVDWLQLSGRGVPWKELVGIFTRWTHEIFHPLGGLVQTKKAATSLQPHGVLR